MLGPERDNLIDARLTVGRPNVPTLNNALTCPVEVGCGRGRAGDFISEGIPH
jgi:hypothetical protein